MRAELGRAVREHMVSDVPIGAFLSGGIDSSAVVALMARTAAAPVNTYSIGYDGGGAASYYNELSYASEVAQALRHRAPRDPGQAGRRCAAAEAAVASRRADLRQRHRHDLSRLGARRARREGDSVGRRRRRAVRRLPPLPRRSLQRRYPASCRTGCAARSLQPLADMLPSGRQQSLGGPRALREASSCAPASCRGASSTASSSRSRLAAQLAELLQDAPARRRRLRSRRRRRERATDPLLRLMRVDAQTQLPEDLLLLTDKMTMARSIECRVPFLDHRLVEAAARIPARLQDAAAASSSTC